MPVWSVAPTLAGIARRDRGGQHRSDFIGGRWGTTAVVERTAPRRAVLDFVERATSGADAIAAEDRVAVFDNDGTLWCEQPVYAQFAFALDRVRALAPQHPEWKTKQPFKAVARRRHEDRGGGRRAAARCKLVMATHAGMTTGRVRQDVVGLARDGAPSALQAALHRTRLPADARTARLSAREWLQDLHRLGRRRRVHARLGGASLRHPARTGDRLQRSRRIRNAPDGKPVLIAICRGQLRRRRAGQAGRHQSLHRPPPDLAVRQFRRRPADAAMDDGRRRRALRPARAPHRRRARIRLRPRNRTSASSTRRSRRRPEQAGPSWT